MDVVKGLKPVHSGLNPLGCLKIYYLIHVKGTYVILKVSNVKYSSLLCLILFIACDSPSRSRIEIYKIDSIRLKHVWEADHSPTIDTLRRSDFYTKERYINKRDSIVTVLLKDSIRHIVGIRQTKNDINIFVCEYYPNGQAKGKINLTDSGTSAGLATYYYEDGRIRAQGNLKDGIEVGTWKEYDNQGVPIKTDNK
jgi:hypothetical protein